MRIWSEEATSLDRFPRPGQARRTWARRIPIVPELAILRAVGPQGYALFQPTCQSRVGRSSREWRRRNARSRARLRDRAAVPGDPSRRAPDCSAPEGHALVVESAETAAAASGPAAAHWHGGAIAGADRQVAGPAPTGLGRGRHAQQLRQLRPTAPRTMRCVGRRPHQHLERATAWRTLIFINRHGGALVDWPGLESRPWTLVSCWVF